MTHGDHETCPCCGEPNTTAVAGLCPRCLLGNALAGETDAGDDRPTAGDGADRPREEISADAVSTSMEPVSRVSLTATAPPGAVPATAAPPGRAARLELFGEIARGGMGVVLRGRDPDLGRELAVKVLREDLRGNPEMVHRFVEEAQIGGQLQHPGIVPIHELGSFGDGRPYFTMKLVKGRTLSRLLGESGPSEADRGRFLGIFEQVCQTVAYAHAHGVIHRDLKPSNVMVGAFGEVQVMDWGLAKVLPPGAPDDESADRVETPVPETVIATVRSKTDSDLSSAGTILGTPSYMAPEQARGEVDLLDERVDVFALGSILCEILTGRPAFIGRSSEEMLRNAARGDVGDALARLDASGAGADLLALARECLAAERGERPRGAGLVAGRLTAYLAGVQERLRAAEVARAAETARAEEATRTAEAARAQTRAERRARRMTAVLAAAGATLIGVVGAGVTWVQRQDAQRAATTAHLVNDAVNEARRREGEARSVAANDPAGWDAALADAHRAADLLDQGRADAALRMRVDALLADLTRERREAAARADLLKVDRRLLADLDDARNGSIDLAAVDRAYAAAFVAAGLNPDRTEPRALGEWVAARPSRAELVVYLDDWAHIRRWIKLRPDQHPDAELVAAARVADPDPWRDRLRAAHKDPTALRALADDEPGLEEQSARSLHLLAIGLKDDARDWDRATRVLRLALRRFPNHFWINLEMAVCMAEKAAASPANQRARWFEERVRFLTAAVASRPQSVSALYDLGNTLVDLGRFEDALEAYRGATRHRPGTAPYTPLGIALRRRGKVKEAEAAFREAIRIKPDDADAHEQLGTVLRELKKLDESLAELREAARLQPENARYHHNYGQSLEASEKLEQAIIAFREAFRLDSKRNHVGDAANSLAHCLVRVNRADEAIAVLEEALRIKPDAVGSHGMLADILTRQRRWAEALKHITEASRLAPANDYLAQQAAVLYLYLGDDAGYRRHCLAMLDRYGNTTDGLAAFRTATSCLLGPRPVGLEQVTALRQREFDRKKAAKPGTPEHDWNYWGMALAEHRNGRFGRADELLKEVRATGGGRRLLADSLRALNGLRLGQKDEDRRRLADCMKTLQAGIEAFSEPPAWDQWLICELFCREAEALIPEGTAPGENGAPGPPEGVNYSRVKSLTRAGRFDEAIDVLREAASRKPDDARALRELGELLAERGRWDEAVKLLDRAADLDLPNSTLWLQVTTLHLYLGDDEGYRRRSVAMLDRFGTTDGMPAEQAAKSGLVGPKPVGFERAFQIAERAYERARGANPNAEHYGWHDLDWALAEYRNGHFDRAADRLKRCRAAGSVIGLQSEALLAMTYQRLGLKAEASRLVSGCRAALQKLAGRASSGWGAWWHDYLTCELFCREAEALARDRSPGPAEGKPPVPPSKPAGPRPGADP